jgi:hypothetical protein
MGLLFLVALVCIAGFIALFATIYNLGERPGFDTRALIGIMAFGGATVLGVVGSLVWLLLRLTKPELPIAPQRSRPEMPISRDYAPQLPAPPGSVTENTTRNFDPSIYGEKGRE